MCELRHPYYRVSEWVRHLQNHVHHVDCVLVRVMHVCETRFVSGGPFGVTCPGEAVVVCACVCVFVRICLYVYALVRVMHV
jgi:hypothetical protein